MTKSGFDLDEIERLLAAATPGEWLDVPTAKTMSEEYSQPFAVMARHNGNFCVVSGLFGDTPKGDTGAETNAALIVTLKRSVPAMLTEIRELRAENARLREMTATNRQAWDNALELGIIPERHRNTVQIMSDGCRAALGEPQ